jgi:thiol-disulfide isomerase/thioredoxin
MTSGWTRRRLVTSGLALAASACATPPPPGDEAPASNHPLAGLTDFTGVPLTPPVLEGKVTVLDFWASWCAPCRQAFRYLDQLYRTYQSRNLQVIAISLDESGTAGRSFVARARPRFDVAWDQRQVVGGRFGVVSLPTTVLLDKNAALVHRHQGFEPRLHELLESHVRRLVDAI